MKRWIIALLTLAGLAVSMTASAQSRNAYFMEGSYFRTDLNPALVPNRPYVALPALSGIGLNMNTNFLSVDNFFYKNGSEVVTALHGSVSTDEFLKRLPNTGKMALNANINIVGVGFYTKRAFWNVGINLRSQTDMAISKELFRAIKTIGNGVYDLSDTSVNTNNYLEAYVGTSWQVLDFLKVGGRVKFLTGLFNASTEVDKIYANVSSEEVTAYLHSPIRMSGPMIDPSQVEIGKSIGGELFNMNMDYLFSHVKSFGASIDLGAEASFLDDQLRVSAAVTDLGFICWSDKTAMLADMVADFYYYGINFDDMKSNSGSNSAILAVDGASGYTSRLTCSLNLGAEYNILNDKIGFGLLSHTEFGRTMTFSELTISANFRPVDIFSATISHTLFSHNKVGIFGLALNLHPNGFNFYIGADYLGLGMAKYGDISIPKSMKSVNVYMGIGFNIGKIRQ